MSRKDDIEKAWRIFAVRVYKDPDAALMVALTTAYDLGRAAQAMNTRTKEDTVRLAFAKRLRARVQKMVVTK